MVEGAAQHDSGPARVRGAKGGEAERVSQLEREGAQVSLVGLVEGPADLVQHLDDAAHGHLRRLPDRHHEHASGRVAGLLVGARVEARVCARVVHPHHLAGARDPAREALTHRQAQGLDLRQHRDAGDEVTALLVDQPEARAVGVEGGGEAFARSGEQGVEVDLPTEEGREVDEEGEAPAHLLRGYAAGALCAQVGG